MKKMHKFKTIRKHLEKNLKIAIFDEDHKRFNIKNCTVLDAKRERTCFGESVDEYGRKVLIFKIVVNGVVKEVHCVFQYSLNIGFFRVIYVGNSEWQGR
jgi:hypothetical protein